MTCTQVEEYLLESIDEPLAGDVRRAVDRHVASCAACGSFAAQLRDIDAQLSSALPPISAPPSIVEGLRRQQHADRVTAFTETLPDVIHLAGCAIATVLSAALLPIDPPVTLTAGVAVTCFTYVVMVIVRSSLEAVDQPDW